MRDMPSLSHVAMLSAIQKSHLTAYMMRNWTMKKAASSSILMTSRANLVLEGKSRMSWTPAGLNVLALEAAGEPNA